MTITTPKPRDERMSLRLPADVKSVLEEAAALSGVSVTDFVLDCAVPEALRRIELDQRVHLNAAQSAEVLALLERPGRVRPEIARAFDA